MTDEPSDLVSVLKGMVSKPKALVDCGVMVLVRKSMRASGLTRKTKPPTGT